MYRRSIPYECTSGRSFDVDPSHFRDMHTSRFLLITDITKPIFLPTQVNRVIIDDRKGEIVNLSGEQLGSLAEMHGLKAAHVLPIDCIMDTYYGFRFRINMEHENLTHDQCSARLVEIDQEQARGLYVDTNEILALRATFPFDLYIVAEGIRVQDMTPEQRKSFA